MNTTPVGNVVALFISKDGSNSRIDVSSIQLDQKGVRQDKFYGKNIQRSVLLTSTESYLLAKKEGISMEYGALGENILINYNPYHLDTGRLLRIGSALLEISQNCTICDHLAAIDPILPQLLSQDRGIFVKVVERGDIKIGDPIYLEQ